MAKSLTPLQYQALNLLAMGLKDREVTRTLDITGSLLKKWKEDDFFQDKLDNENRRRVNELVPRAIKGLQNLMFSKNEKIQFDTFKDILDRAGIKAPTVLKQETILELRPTEQHKQLIMKARMLEEQEEQEEQDESDILLEDISEEEENEIVLKNI